MDSWPPLAFLEPADFDFVTFNLYAFWPKAIADTMGLAGMTRWFADHFAGDKPLLVGETGGYSVSEASQTAAGGFGGLSEYNQSLKDIESLRQTLEGHAAGNVLVSWIDTWHYPNDPDHHDNEPWEWDGLLAIPTDSAEDMDGIPRQVYRDVTVYNRLIPIVPKDNHIYPILRPLPIQVNGSEDVASIRYCLNDGEWVVLDGSGHGWFQGSFRLPKLARKRQSMTFQALDKDETVIATKSVSFLTDVLPERVSIEPKKGTRLVFSVTVKDGRDHPIANRKVLLGCFYPVSFHEGRDQQTTNDAGEVTFSCPAAPESRDRYLFIAAGTDSPERSRAADLRIFVLGR
jgi:hypothetical protein